MYLSSLSNLLEDLEIHASVFACSYSHERNHGVRCSDPSVWFVPPYADNHRRVNTSSQAEVNIKSPAAVSPAFLLVHMLCR